MAKRKRRGSGKRKRKRGTRWMGSVLVLLVLAGAGFALWGWSQGREWRPDEATWPDQGALVGAADGAVEMRTLKGLGAGFVYLEASEGAQGKDPAFTDNFARARVSGLQIGAVHHFDPCERADGQSANFVTMVPRDVELLPPAIMLDRTAEGCPERVSQAAIQSELLTLVNQIEAHAGKPAILAPTEEFEQTYRIAGRMERNLWLERNWFEPTYAGRPWLLWTANGALQTEAAQEPLRWVVIRP